MATKREAKKSNATRRSRKQAVKQPEFAIEARSVLLLIGLFFAIGYSGIKVVEAAQDTRSLYQTLGEVQREQDALLEENSRLSLERSSLSSLQKIEQVAEEQLDMEFPVSVQGVTR